MGEGAWRQVHVRVFVRLSAVCIANVHDPWASRQSWVRGQDRALSGLPGWPQCLKHKHRYTHTRVLKGEGLPPMRLISPLGLESRQKYIDPNRRAHTHSLRCRICLVIKHEWRCTAERGSRDAESEKAIQLSFNAEVKRRPEETREVQPSS